MIEHIHPDGEPTPTMQELYERKDGSAEAIEFDKKMKPTRFRLTPKGHQVLGEIMKRNAAGTLARGGGSAEAGARLRRSQAEREKS